MSDCSKCNNFSSGISCVKFRFCKEEMEEHDKQIRADAIEIVHRFFMDELNQLETYIDEDDGVSEIYKDQAKANYLFNMNKRLCERLKEQKNE